MITRPKPRQLFCRYLSIEPKVAQQCGIYDWSSIDKTDTAAVQRLADLMHRMASSRWRWSSSRFSLRPRILSDVTVNLRPDASLAPHKRAGEPFVLIRHVSKDVSSPLWQFSASLRLSKTSLSA